MGRILAAALQEVEAGDQRRQFVSAAAQRFSALGTDGGMRIAQMLQQDPDAATEYADSFGGWNALYQMERTNAAQRAFLGAVGPQQVGSGAVVPRSRDAILQALLPAMLQYGDVITPQMADLAAKAYAPEASVPAWVNQVDPDLYENYGEFVAAGEGSGNWAEAWKALRPRASKRDDDVIGGKYLAVRDESGRIVGARPIPGVRIGDGDGDGGPSKPPSGYRWRADGSLEAIPGGPAAMPARIADILARESQGEQISEGDARLVNNWRRNYPGLVDLEGDTFRPTNPAPPPAPAAAPAPQPTAPPAFEDLVPPKAAEAERPKPRPTGGRGLPPGVRSAGPARPASGGRGNPYAQR